MKRIFGRFKEMGEADFRTLVSIEAGLRRREFVPKDDLLKYTRFDKPDLEYRLKRLDGMGLIHRQSSPYEGHQLLPHGYDFLALNVLVRRNKVVSIGRRIAVGKESEIYEALGANESALVVKFHRLGMPSFQRIVRLRGYLGKRRHFSWIYAARLAAEREFSALTRLGSQVDVPEGIGQNRNAVLMSMFDGYELADFRLDNPEVVLESIIAEIRRAQLLGVVHGDLSEFNVMVNGEDIVIIDWPQWIELSHPQARDVFERDIRNTINFFRKKYRIEARDSLAQIMRSTTWQIKST